VPICRFDISEARHTIVLLIRSAPSVKREQKRPGPRSTWVAAVYLARLPRNRLLVTEPIRVWGRAVNIGNFNLLLIHERSTPFFANCSAQIERSLLRRLIRPLRKDAVSPFSSQFIGSSFNSGFNSGFTADGTSGFVGFCSAPSVFNTNFGTGFRNMVSSVSQGLGLTNTLHGTTGTADGVTFQSR
jgi:hypothetical protein